MANEAVIIELLGDRGDIVDYAIGNTFAVEKGTVLKLIDPRTLSGAITNTALSDVPAGIAASEKVASDGQVYLGCYTNGIFDMKASGAITVGQPVKSAGYNYVMAAVAADVVSGVILGRALETASDAEVIAVRVRL